MKGNPQFTFSQVPTVKTQRSTFNRSHGYKTTFDSGYLIPFYVDEALPGDTYQVKVSAFARLITPIVPIMDNLYMDFFFFAVPNRLVWDHWQNFCGEAEDYGIAATDYVVPKVVAPAGGFGIDNLYDYLGIPTEVPGLEISALFPRAYNLIWNEWFRDENLQGKALVPKHDGPDPYANYFVRRRGKRHDYFTSCLPWPQKGPGVELPLGGLAPVLPGGNEYPTFVTPGSSGTPSEIQVGSAGEMSLINGNAGFPAKWSTPALVADLSQATAVTINSLRQAFQLQRMYEKDARGGTRYVELLKSHFGVTSPDARLQRPEFLGGGSTPIIFNPVTQTSGTPVDPTSGNPQKGTPQGNLAAYAVSGAQGIGFSKSFVEHSIIFGLVMVRADLSYQQGLPRMFSRKTRFDFYWPALAHLGEQAVLNKEIYAQGPSVLDPTHDNQPFDDLVFGYQERWAEYRYFPSTITGKFRSTAPGTLDVWHLAKKFDDLPVLSDVFIEENPPVERIIAVSNEPQLLFDSHLSIKCTRPMPTYSVPGFIDHF